MRVGRRAGAQTEPMRLQAPSRCVGLCPCALLCFVGRLFPSSKLLPESVLRKMLSPGIKESAGNPNGSPARCHLPCALQWLRNSLPSALKALRRVILASSRLVCTEYRSVPIALAMASGLRIGLLPLSRFHLSGSPDSV